MGHQVYVLDPFGVTSFTSAGFNVLDLAALPGVQFDAEAETVATALSSEHHFSSDRYWEDTATSLTASLLAHVATHEDPAHRNLNQVRKLLFEHDFDYNIAVLLDQKKVKSQLAREGFAAYLTAPNDKTRPCIFSTASTYFRSLSCDSVSHTLARSSFALSDLLEGKPLDIFIVVPPDKLESHKGLLRLWLTTLMLTLQKRRHVPSQRTLVIVDEAACLGSLPLLRTTQTLMRGYGVQTLLAFQDLGQLKQLYAQDWTTMMNNSGVIAAWDFRNGVMIEEWAKFFGLDPFEVQRMGRDEQLVLIERQGCQKLRRCDYRADSLFRGLWKPNPRFQTKPSNSIS